MVEFSEGHRVALILDKFLGGFDIAFSKFPVAFWFNVMQAVFFTVKIIGVYPASARVLFGQCHLYLSHFFPLWVDTVF